MLQIYVSYVVTVQLAVPCHFKAQCSHIFGCVHAPATGSAADAALDADAPAVDDACKA